MHLYRSPSPHLKAGWELTTLRELTMMSAASGSSRCGCCSSALLVRTQRKGSGTRLPFPFCAGEDSCMRFLCGLRHGLHRAQEKNVAGNSDQQEDSCRAKGPKKRVRRLHYVTGRNRSCYSGELIAKIQDSSYRADAFFRGNQRGNRPSYWGCC